MATIDDRRTASQAGAVLAIVGVVNVPIIHFSVEWWNTLHQAHRLGFDSHRWLSMLIFTDGGAFKFITYTILARVRVEILDGERRTAWVNARHLEGIMIEFSKWAVTQVCLPAYALTALTLTVSVIATPAVPALVRGFRL